MNKEVVATSSKAELTASEIKSLVEYGGFFPKFDLVYSAPGSAVYSAWKTEPGLVVAVKCAEEQASDIRALALLKDNLGHSAGATLQNVAASDLGVAHQSIKRVKLKYPRMFPLDERVTFKDRVLVTEWIYGPPLKKY